MKTFSTKRKQCNKDLAAVGLTSDGVDALAKSAQFVSYTTAGGSLNSYVGTGTDLVADSSKSTIYYFDADLTNDSFSILLGDMLHELIHLSGFGGPPGPGQDTALQDALHLKLDPNDTHNITKKLAKDCFKGAK